MHLSVCHAFKCVCVCVCVCHASKCVSIHLCVCMCVCTLLRRGDRERDRDFGREDLGPPDLLELLARELPPPMVRVLGK